MPDGLVGGFPYETWRLTYGAGSWTAKWDLTPSSSAESPIKRFSNSIIALVDGNRILLVSQDGGNNFTAMPAAVDQFNGSTPFDGIVGSGVRGCGISFDVNGRLYALYSYTGATSRISLFYTDNYTSWTYANMTRTGLSSTGGRLDNVECNPTDANYIACGGCRDDAFAHDCIYVTTDKALTWTRYLSGPGFAPNYNHAYWGVNNRIFLSIDLPTGIHFYTCDQPWAAVTERFVIPALTAQSHDDLIRISASERTFFYLNSPIYRTQDNGDNWELITQTLTQLGAAACYDPGIDVFYVVGSECHALANASTTAAGAGVWTQVVMPAGVTSIGTNDLILLPAASPPPTPPGGGEGGGPPRFGPFHPTRLQRFQRNVLPSHKPQVIG